jgi:hypothetical protein
MASYWCAFRLAADKAYRSRYDAFLARVFALRGKTAATWTEASYFLAFQADLSLEEVARQLTATLDAKRDMLVVGVIGTAEVVWFGQLQHPATFGELFPGATRFG